VRLLAISVALFLASLATSPVSSACSVTSLPISVGPNFWVKVSGYDGPVKGLRLNLSSGSPRDRGRSAVTDDNGIATFNDAPRGTQYLQAGHDNGPGFELDVKRGGPANIIVPMQWPAIEPIQVRSLTGTMRAPDAVPGRLEQPVLSLELLDGISGRVLASINTTSRGAFDFGKLAPGVYFIHLKPYTAFSQTVEGLISVAVDPAAPARAGKLDLNLTWTSCGLGYMDQLQCPQPDLYVNKLEGRVSAFRGAEIVLLDVAQSEVVHVSTDRNNGDFSFPGPLAGTFELRIDGGGFTPVHTPLHIEPTAANSALEIETSNGFACSTVRAK